MKSDWERKEPGFSEDGVEPKPVEETTPSLEPPASGPLDPGLKLAALAIALACLIFVADRIYQRYQEQRAIRVVEAALIEFQEEMEAMAHRSRAQSETQRQRIRAERADTSQGKWLAKNCEDWQSSYRNLRTETAEIEMRRHCALYQEYLETGITRR